MYAHVHVYVYVHVYCMYMQVSHTVSMYVFARQELHAECVHTAQKSCCVCPRNVWAHVCSSY